MSPPLVGASDALILILFLTHVTRPSQVCIFKSEGRIVRRTEVMTRLLIPPGAKPLNYLLESYALVPPISGG